MPSTSETIPGCEIEEEESPGREHSNRPGERSPPRTPLQSPATASSAEPGSPQLSKGESRPVRSTFPRRLCLYLRSGRSLRRKRKREPYPCGSSSSFQTGQKGKKTTSASEQDGLQKSSPAQSQTPTIQQTHQQPQVSEESWSDGGYVAQQRRSQPHTS